MNYWKGMLIAFAFDLALLMGNPAALIGPKPAPVLPPVEWRTEPVAVETALLDDLTEVSLLEDSLMTYLTGHLEDVDAMERLAAVYASNGWFDNAIGPLARALQLNAERWSLWVSLDRAVRMSGMATITDEELVTRANAFVEAVEMWGDGC
jgi:hypothetical protein